MKKVLVLFVSLIVSLGIAQEEQFSWPRNIEAGDNYTITL